MFHIIKNRFLRTDVQILTPLLYLKKHLVLPQVTQIISKDVLKFLKTIRAASKLDIMAYADLAEELLCRV